MSVSVLQDPVTGDELEEHGEYLFNPVVQKKYPLTKGYYSMLQGQKLAGDNQKYCRFYDRIAWSYNWANWIFLFFKFGGEEKARREFLNELTIADGAQVLEVSIGTGNNLPYLNHKAKYYGIDISKGMLQMAARHLRRWKIPARMFQAEAENLPFQDNSFDVVLHHGGINYFNDQAKAIREMIRVAKPGATILISDETEKLVEEVYQKNPITVGVFNNTYEVTAPIHLIPEEMQDLKFKTINQGFICLTFKKPVPSLQ
jgi:ubiquinone/menaquinone biosynthesis C-methylase UbiE